MRREPAGTFPDGPSPLLVVEGTKDTLTPYPTVSAFVTDVVPYRGDTVKFVSHCRYRARCRDARTRRRSSCSGSRTACPGPPADRTPSG